MKHRKLAAGIQFYILSSLLISFSSSLRNNVNLNTFIVEYDPDVDSAEEEASNSVTQRKQTTTTTSAPAITTNSPYDLLPKLGNSVESRVNYRATHYAHAKLRMTKYKGRKPSFNQTVPWESRRILKDNNEPKKLVCYYNVPYVHDRPFAIFPEQIDPFLCTHVIVGFGRIQNLTITPNDLRDEEFYNRTIGLKQKNPNLKVMLVIGGASDKSFPDMVATNVTRATFIENCAKYLQVYKFDGLDFDWEFPAWQGKIEEKYQFMDFLNELRHYIKSKNLTWVLSAAVPAPQPIVDVGYDIPQLAKVLDFINLMTYDFHFYSSVTPFTGPNSPLRPSKLEIGVLKTMNTEWAAKYWYENGMPADKIIVGIPVYGHTFRLLDLSESGYWSLAEGQGTVGRLGYINYPETCDFIDKNGTVVVFDDETKEPYARNDLDWISFDNEQSGKIKAEWIKDFHLGGAMIYCINAEDAWKICKSSQKEFPIINTIKTVLFPDA